MCQQRDLEQQRRDGGHRRRRVEGATADLDEDVSVAPSCPEREQRGEAAHHEAGQKSPCP